MRLPWWGDWRWSGSRTEAIPGNQDTKASLAGQLQLEQAQARGSLREGHIEATLVGQLAVEQAPAWGSLREDYIEAALAGQLELEWTQARRSPGGIQTMVFSGTSNPREDSSSSPLVWQKL